MLLNIQINISCSYSVSTAIWGLYRFYRVIWANVSNMTLIWVRNGPITNMSENMSECNLKRKKYCKKL